MTDLHEMIRTYRTRIFWSIFLSSFTVVVVIGFLMYHMTSDQKFRDIQDELTAIASKTASLIPAETHEALTKREQMDNDDYNLLELYLQSVMAANPKIDDIYTLRPTEEEGIFTFVVSGEETHDDNGDGVIDEGELKAQLGEEYDATESPDLINGLKGPSVDQQVTYDKWGAWLSGYAPLRDKDNNVVAIVGVDYPAETVSAERHSMFRTIMIYLAILVPVVIGGVSLLVCSMITRPMRMFMSAITRVLHGDHDFHLDSKRKGDKVFVELFNNLVDVFSRDKTKDKKDDSE